MNVTIAEAKARFSELLRRAEAGQQIVVTRHGRPVATISAPSRPVAASSLIGAMKGRIRIAEDFDELGPEWDEYLR